MAALPASVRADDAPALVPAAAPGTTLNPALVRVLERLSTVKLFGAASLNWRNVGPREPGFETQIQNQVFLADMYLGVEGAVTESVPINIEWNLPTSGRGTPRLSQAYAEYNRIRRIKFQMGKFMVPFGRYNELYRPDQYLAVTRPLLYASPDSLDLVVRPNSPRPPLSYGYSDIGLRWSWYPVRVHPLVPSEVTVFVVNGISEQKNRLRTFPNPSNLGIPGPGTSGVAPDFGHENNNLADNNNAKTLGGRIVFALGDLRLPWPVPEQAADLTGTHLGLSGMGGNYDLEGYLNYDMWSADWSFEYRGVSLSGEVMYSRNHFLTPLLQSSATLNTPSLIQPITQSRHVEHLYGYFIQGAFPLMRKPPYGKRLTGLLVYNEMYRRGPLLDFLLNYGDQGAVYESMTAYRVTAPYVTRKISKYTGGIHWQLAEHFAAKFEYSYWVMGKSTIRSENSLGLNDIYQGAFSLVMGF